MIQRILIVFFSCVALLGLKAQSHSPFRTYTTSDGLPSNHIYKTVEDDYGFLWVATDAGVARFDGKRFQVFTTREGLPDNEVLDIVKEKSGRIWVNCFKQSPCYFDFIKNRFINAKEDSLLAKVNGSLLIDLFALKDGGVMYVNEKGSYIFKSNLLSFYPNKDDGLSTFLIKAQQDSSQIYAGSKKVGQITEYSINAFRNNQLDSSKVYEILYHFSGRKYLEGDIFYQMVSEKNKIYLFSNFKLNPFRFKIDSIKSDEAFTHITFSKNTINLITASGELLLYDKKSLQFLNRIKGGFSPNDLCEDQLGNYWIATIDKGLILYKERQIETIAMPDGFYNTHFLSIARKPNGMVLAGNFNSEIIEANGRQFFIHKLGSGSATNWQRKIILSQNKVYSFSEGGSFKNFTIPLTQASGIPPYYTKTAIKLNDSIIVAATMGALDKLNTITDKTARLNTPKKRASAIALLGDQWIYYGTTDGLYKYNYLQDSSYDINTYQPLLKERVMGLTSTKDGLIWVATSSNGIVVVKKDTVIGHFTLENGLISNDCKSIVVGMQNQIWLGTGDGISIINYKQKQNCIQISTQNISINDGLSSNIINEMLFEKDTVYAATGNGISIIPANLRMPKYPIPVYLTGVRINQKDTTILSNYSLEYTQQNIQLQFAAIELSGHFKNLEYTINNKGKWLELNEPILNLQLNSGHYTIQVRAVDVNGNRSNKILELQFDIASPFWKTFWFWLLFSAGLVGLVAYFIFKNASKKRKELFEKLNGEKLIQELEMQSIKAQMNPHFVFNCLNSIKSLNYQQKNEEAGIFIDRFSKLMRDTLDLTSETKIPLANEIAYIDNYLSLEQLRFGNKLNWTIKIDPDIDTEQINVPTLFLQPYVENAIKHGIHHLINIDGLICIIFKLVNNQLVIEIDDNGIGREASNRINQNTASYHTSKGMNLAARRSSIYQMDTIIVDKKNPEGMPTGTCVIIKINIT